MTKSAPKYCYTSVTRIAPLPELPFSVDPLNREHWGTGDYVVGEVFGRSSSLYRIELTTGRIMPVYDGDLVVGTLGKRAATLEATGDWHHIGQDGVLDALTGAGLIGKCLSRSPLLPSLLRMHYKGHVMIAGQKQTMQDFVKIPHETPFTLPVVLLIGSSMSAGKTTAARVIIRLLRKAGLRVVGAKLTGAGRYRDIMSMSDAGAEAVFDFIDVGLPSTVCPEDEFREALRHLLSMMGGVEADVAVIEAGASPLEPYNGEAAIDSIKDNLRFTVLCASDPYSVLGITSAFGYRPDIVTGIATNTHAGIDLIHKLSGIKALNVLDPEALPELSALVLKHVGTRMTMAFLPTG